MSARFGLGIVLLGLASGAATPAFVTQEATLPVLKGRASVDPSSVQDARVEESSPTHSFAIPDTRAARGLEETTEGHIAARRWSEALDTLQEMLEDHRADVLGGSRPVKADGKLSEQPVHRGAARHARDRMWSLPAEARALYADEHRAESGLAFERARELGDAQGLCEVARRWPLTDAARRAWRALGDLELERGHKREALAAWARALASTLEIESMPIDTSEAIDRALERLSRSSHPWVGALRERLEYAKTFLDGAGSSHEDGEARSEASQSIHLSGPGEGRGPPPGAECDAWAQRFRLPEHPFRRSDSLFPARSGDKIFVSTSLRLLALQAYTGTTLWDSREPAGWGDVSQSERGDFFKGIDWDGAMIAPAASAHVAIAALQIPVAFIDNDEFQRIPITTRIPDRRLFAFDVENGKKLWDHVPPLTWDGESGGFIERMSVAGPPVIAGSRVIAPFCRMQGRIDYHVGCFDLETGKLLWSTNLISGQRELNMFGRAEREFCAPPLLVAGDRVVALTQLGAVAALDLFTGEILWETLYQQIALPKNKDYRAPQRVQKWRNAPPVASGDTVIAAPFDSRDLIGLDLEKGTLLWSLDHDTIALMADRNADIELLVGAGENVVYLSGSKVIALESRGGLHRQAPTTRKWVYTDEALRDGRPGRAVLCADRIVVPSSTHRTEIDLDAGQVRASTPWPEGGEGGNLLIGAGELFAVSGSHVEGYFEWDVLVDRARAQFEEHPDDAVQALALGRLLARRGAAEWQRGQTNKARAMLAEAKTVLERALGLEHDDAPRAVAHELHSVLRSQARVLADLADSAGALRALREARASALGARELCDTLIEEYALLESRDPAGRALDLHEANEVVNELERSCAEMDVTCDAIPVDRGAATDQGASDPGVRLPARWVPIVSASPKSDAVPCEMSIGLWALLERARMNLETQAWAAAFADLHRILALYPEVEIGHARAGEIAREAIGGLLRAGRTEGHAAFEAEAEALYAEAQATRDHELLARIPARFPFSRTAEKANDTLLEWASTAKDATSVARIVLSELPRDWAMEQATPRDVDRCLRLADVMQVTGNIELARELLRSLAEVHPDHASELAPFRGKPLRDLARDIERWEPPAGVAVPSTFDAASKTRKQARGEHTVLGRAQPERVAETLSSSSPSPSARTGSDPRSPTDSSAPSRATPADSAAPASSDPAASAAIVRLCFAKVQSDRRTSTFFALDTSDPLIPAWSTELAVGSLPPGSAQNPWSKRVAFSAGRLLIATNDEVVALNTADGSPAWSWHPSIAVPESMSLTSAAGVAVVVVRLSADKSFVQALDAHGGTELWRESLALGPLASLPLVSSNRVVFLPSPGRKQVLVRDLFTGRRAMELELDVSANNTIDQDAWIESDLLIVPWFNETRSPERNHMLALDLGTGRVVWRLGFDTDAGEKRTLAGILQHAKKTYLIVRPWPAADRPPAPSGLFELHTPIGALTPLANVRLAAEDRVIGMNSKSARTRLANPRIFVLSSRAGASKGEARVRAIDPASGELWSQALPAMAEEVLSTTMPEPAVSETSVAVAYTVWAHRQTQSQPSTSLAFFDVTTGLARGNRMLSEVQGKSDDLTLVSLGGALVVRGKDQLEVLQ